MYNNKYIQKYVFAIPLYIYYFRHLTSAGNISLDILAMYKWNPLASLLCGNLHFTYVLNPLWPRLFVLFFLPPVLPYKAKSGFDLAYIINYPLVLKIICLLHNVQSDLINSWTLFLVSPFTSPWFLLTYSIL